MEKVDNLGNTTLHNATITGHVKVARYLLEQGADRDKNNIVRYTSLHIAANWGHLEITKLLMVYGADLNARTNDGRLPIDMGFRITEKIKQAIRDEPRRRMDHGHKRATEHDRHPDAATSASTEQPEREDAELSINNMRPRLEDGAADEVVEEGKVVEEDEDSEPSDDEED